MQNTSILASAGLIMNSILETNSKKNNPVKQTNKETNKEPNEIKENFLHRKRSNDQEIEEIITQKLDHNTNNQISNNQITTNNTPSNEIFYGSKEIVKKIATRAKIEEICSSTPQIEISQENYNYSLEQNGWLDLGMEKNLQLVWEFTRRQLNLNFIVVGKKSIEKYKISENDYDFLLKILKEKQYCTLQRILKLQIINAQILKEILVSSKGKRQLEILVEENDYIKSTIYYLKLNGGAVIEIGGGRIDIIINKKSHSISEVTYNLFEKFISHFFDININNVLIDDVILTSIFIQNIYYSLTDKQIYIYKSYDCDSLKIKININFQNNTVCLEAFATDFFPINEGKNVSLGFMKEHYLKQIIYKSGPDNTDFIKSSEQEIYDFIRKLDT